MAAQEGSHGNYLEEMGDLLREVNRLKILDGEGKGGTKEFGQQINALNQKNADINKKYSPGRILPGKDDTSKGHGRWNLLYLSAIYRLS